MVQSNRDDIMFERFELLVKDKINDIKNKRIIIIGVGGVGSYTVESLIRCGISNITIVDNDIVDITNLNRQLMTTYDNIGLNKVDVLEKRIKSINKECNVKKLKVFVDSINIDSIIDNYDYVVDACDTVSTKIEIIKICNKKNIKLISSMGTGNKMDPTKLEITDIYKTNYDPLAKIIRKECRKLGIKKLMVVCSKEKPIKKSIKVIPSNSFVPATAGLFITSYIINDIVGDLRV